MNVLQIAATGGFLAILTLIHFVSDWVFQSHQEAMTKHNNAKVRAKHCLIYTLGFFPYMGWIGFDLLSCVLSSVLLFLSHFYLDTYHLVFLWAKEVRQPPSMMWHMDDLGDLYCPDGSPYGAVCDLPRHQIKDRCQQGIITVEQARHELNLLGFQEFVETPLGKILMIAIDQISHIVCLLPIAVLSVMYV